MTPGLRRVLGAVSMVCQTVLLAVIVHYDDSWAGKVIWRVTSQHGLHVGDIPVLLVWVVGMAATAAGLRETTPAGRVDREPEERPVVHD